MYVFEIPAPTPNHFAELIRYLLEIPWLLALLVSTAWIIYRVFLVFQKPTEDLEEILGIDIPPIPDVALARITGSSVLLYWKPPENYHSPLKHLIQVNGINVGEFERSDATIQVTGLQPGNCYGIRAVATNQAGNSSYSDLIQVQTIPKGGHRASKLFSADSAHAKRNSQPRRVSQPLPGPDTNTAAATEERERDRKNALDETIVLLTQHLENLKRQNEEAETQLSDESAEAESAKAELLKKREELRKSAEESDKACQEFRKQVVELEKQCKAAQRKKSAKERVLHQKKAERQKMKDEIARWETETKDAYQSAEHWRSQKAGLETEHEEQMQSVQAEMEKVQTDCGRMEEELRELGIKVKDLDEKREKANEEKYAAEVEAEKRREAEEQEAEERIQQLQMQYSAWWKMITELEVQRDHEAERVSELLRFKEMNPALFAPVPGLDYAIPPMFPSAARFRTNLPRNTTLGSALSYSSYPGAQSNHHAFDSTSSASPSFGAAYPHYGVAAGSPDQSEQSVLAPAEIDALTAGAPMSPSANGFLPSDLLMGDDDEPPSMFARTASMKKEGSSSRPQSFRPSSTDPKREDPQSPLSLNSASPSLLSSPRESLSNIHSSIYGRERPGDDDERSLPPNSSPFSMLPTSGAGSSRKISGLFGWNRREKSSLGEPPLLGTLKQGQSQSFPLNTEDDPDLNPNGRRKTTNIWGSAVSGLWNRGAGAQPELPKPRRGVFGTRLEPSEVLGESTSRPSSIYSFGENTNQGPLDYPQYGFGTPDSTRPRASGVDWPSASNGPWSHTQSRRASLQHGSTSNLSLGSTPLGPRDDDASSLSGKRANKPAPIGTERFRISQRSNTPKLNPAAPSFTARIFTRGESRKTPKAEKSFEFGSEKSKSQVAEKPRDFDSISKSSSPAISRKSQDQYSVATADSLGESYESLEASYSGTPSDMTPSSGTPKETLMQRLTRKSSSTKFWTKDRNSKPPSKGAPSTPGEVEDDGGDYLGRSVESSTSTPQDKRGSLSWSRVMGKNKKKGELAPSETSERASEAEGDDED